MQVDQLQLTSGGLPVGEAHPAGCAAPVCGVLGIGVVVFVVHGATMGVVLWGPMGCDVVGVAPVGLVVVAAALEWGAVGGCAVAVPSVLGAISCLLCLSPWCCWGCTPWPDERVLCPVTQLFLLPSLYCLPYRVSSCWDWYLCAPQQCP